MFVAWKEETSYLTAIYQCSNKPLNGLNEVQPKEKGKKESDSGNTRYEAVIRSQV